MNIILDVEGGQNAPREALAAAAAISLQRPINLSLVGDEATITKHLGDLAHNPARLMVHHCGQRPAIDFAMELLADDDGAALVTAGTTDNLLRAAASHLQLASSGITQPAMAAVYPTARRRGKAKDPFVLLLDVGASWDASPEDLVSYAAMGSAYASRVSRNPRPSVALLGPSITPGPPALAQAAAMLRKDPNIHCIGQINGLDIPRGSADVIVCAGEVGNIVIRLLEGVGEVAQHMARSIQEQSIRGRLAVQALSNDMASMASITDWKEYGGAPLLGYDRPIIATDPNASAEAIDRAIRLAVKTIRTDIIGAIRALS